MIIARVIGNVVATMQYDSFKGHKIMIVQPVDEYGKNRASTFLACDTVQAGPGDTVLVQQEGNTARQLLGNWNDPFHSVIVGIVDHVELGNNI